MPYIKKALRGQYKRHLLYFPSMSTKGNLEYCIYLLMLHYMKDKEARYCNLHDCVYGVVHAAHEFERKFLDAREDEAEKDNGGITLDE